MTSLEGEDFENVPRRFRTDSESTTDTVSSSYSVGSNISTVSRLSMLSSGSTITSGGIFKEDEKELEPNPEGPKSGPDMSKLRDIKHKQKRTDMYLNLLRQKRRVSWLTCSSSVDKIIAKNERTKAKKIGSTGIRRKGRGEENDRIDEKV